MTPKLLVAKIVRRTSRSLRILYYRLISDNRPVARNVRVTQPLFCTGRGIITLSDCHVGVEPSPRLWDGYVHLEARDPRASIQIAADTWLNNSAVIIAERTSITISGGCLLGPGVQIFDSDFHSIESDLRSSGQHICAPVYLEENVFVGASVIILKGVRIGRNSVVAAGAVVATDVPENSIAAGVPARVTGHVRAACQRK